MTYPITTAHTDHLNAARTLRWCTCWYIEYRGDSLFLTDHNEGIEFQGGYYSPISGFSASARQKQEGLRDNNLEFQSNFSQASVLADGIRAGRFDEAKVTEFTVDWMYPWAGKIKSAVYWINRMEYTDDQWRGQLGSRKLWLQQISGSVYGDVHCDRDLGDAGCTVDLAPWTITFTVDVTFALTPRLAFQSNDLTGFPKDYFVDGKVSWLSGANVAINDNEVKVSPLDTGVIQLQLNMPYDIEVGDTGTVYPGCPKTQEACYGVDGTIGKPWPNNIINYGAYPGIPGADRVLQTPDG